MLNTFVSFHAEKGEIFIGPNGFKIRIKKYLILDFWVIGGTTAITGWYHRLTPDTRPYHRLTELGDRALAIPSPDKGCTTIGSINC